MPGFDGVVDVDCLAVVHFLGAYPKSLVGTATHNADDVSTPRLGHLHRVTAYAARGAHNDEPLAGRDTIEVEGAKCRDPGNRERGRLVIGDTVRNPCQCLPFSTPRHAGLLRICAV